MERKAYFLPATLRIGLFSSAEKICIYARILGIFIFIALKLVQDTAKKYLRSILPFIAFG